jgi:hypothetical protein
MGCLKKGEYVNLRKLLAAALLSLLVSGYLKLGLMGLRLSAKQDKIKADWRMTKMRVFIVLKSLNKRFLN